MHILLALHVAEDVCLNVPHRQFVWTIPKRLRVFFRFHRPLLHRLPELAWQSLLEVYRSLLGDDATPGAIFAVQTFGQLIHFHPHIHALVTDGAFAPDGSFLRLPDNLTHAPFLRLWENKVFDLLLAENRIEPAVVAQIRSWRHSGFGVDRSVLLDAGDRVGLERLAQYIFRGPFSLARLISITPEGKVLYKAEKDHPQQYPEPASGDLLPGIRRNFQLFQPLDLLAELTQHIPNKGEHLVRYFGHYSNKSRGRRAKLAAAARADGIEPPPLAPCDPLPPAESRRRWAALIKHIYHTDPLRCPKCGGTMKIIAFIEAHQKDVIKKILRHCGLWESRPSRAPPAPSAARTSGARDLPAGPIYEPDGDFLDHAAREAQETVRQLDIPTTSGLD